jgi:hypothetical protein
MFTIEELREKHHRNNVMNALNNITKWKKRGSKKLILPVRMGEEVYKRFVNDIKNDKEYEVTGIDEGVLIIFKEKNMNKYHKRLKLFVKLKALAITNVTGIHITCSDKTICSIRTPQEVYDFLKWKINTDNVSGLENISCPFCIHNAINQIECVRCAWGIENGPCLSKDSVYDKIKRYLGDNPAADVKLSKRLSNRFYRSIIKKCEKIPV